MSGRHRVNVGRSERRHRRFVDDRLIDDGRGKEEWTDEKRSRTKNFHHGGVGNDFTTFVPYFPASGQQNLLGK
jgi:hypothetical protein